MANCREVGVTILHIRLEVGALRPFVPGIDKHEPLARAIQLPDGLKGMLKPRLKAARIAAPQNVGNILAPCGIVPAGSDTWEARERLARLRRRANSDG